MTRFVALLRGINVGRGNRVPMAELRELLAGLGYGNVRTLLNSGNVIFESTGRSAAGHADRIRAALAEGLEVDVPVIVKSAKEFAAIESDNALVKQVTEPSRLLVAFTRDVKDLKPLAALASLVRAPERMHVGAHALYLWCPEGILQSKAAEALLGKPGKAATTRNWATVLKISELLGRE